MIAQAETADLWSDLERHGIAREAFDFRGQLSFPCPYGEDTHDLVINQRTQRVRCDQCNVDASARAFADKLDQGSQPEVIDLAETFEDFDEAPAERPDRPHTGAPAGHDAFVERAVRLRQLELDMQQARHERRAARRGKLVERLIMTLLAVVFLAAGLAAAALSGFANYTAFSQSVSDPLQGQIWGWSGVIASVCSFGGFTFFWWHMSARRRSEGLRALIFALAGAATSLAGTAMFMDNNVAAQDAAQVQAAETRAVIESQIEDWTRQLEGIPASTRSIAGLEAYIAGVEAAGRTHQKPYRDAQNELGLARRRADLETKLAGARQQLLGRDSSLVVSAQPEHGALPSWFFALMLEIFSSQGTSIAFVSLLLLYSARAPASPSTPRGPGS